MNETSFKKSECGAKPVFGKAIIAAAILVAMSATVVHAQLGPQHTPLGATKAGSADGVIPAWVPPGQQDVGWTYGKFRGDHFKYKDDKPLYTVDASNYEKYADKLSPGQIEMFKKVKGYKLIVYPTRRTCGVPDFVAENTKKNIGFAKLDAAGFGLEEAYTPGIPFPLPKTGVEAMWNSKMRYRGNAVHAPKTVLAVSPKPGNDDWIETQAEQLYVHPWGKRGTTLFSQANKVEAYAYYLFQKPASYAGQAGIFTLRASEAAETFIYFPGQRRVRRMPAYTYDSPALGMDNQYNIDEANIFFGAIDRFDWKLVGTKEMLVQYNSFGQYSIKTKKEDLAKRDFLDPAQLRYEMHRMVAIELTVRNGMRHIAPKRIIYLDEDSWSPASMVDFDAKGNVSKFREAGVIPVYETGTCDTQAFAQHNLAEGRYMIDFTSTGTGEDLRWVVDGANDSRFKSAFFTSDNLRSISDR
jgi:hypothetical protein